MEVFFTLWKTNAKKIKKDQGLMDLTNPIGSYLNSLDNYLQKGGNRDVKMFSEEDLKAIQKSKFFKNELRTFDLAKVLKKLSVKQADMKVKLLTSKIEMGKENIVFNEVLDGLIYCLSNKKVSLFDIQNEVMPKISHKETIGEIAYNLTYQETSLLSNS